MLTDLHILTMMIRIKVMPDKLLCIAVFIQI